MVIPTIFFSQCGKRERERERERERDLELPWQFSLFLKKLFYELLCSSWQRARCKIIPNDKRSISPASILTRSYSWRRLGRLFFFYPTIARMVHLDGALMIAFFSRKLRSNLHAKVAVVYFIITVAKFNCKFARILCGGLVAQREKVFNLTTWV